MDAPKPDAEFEAAQREFDAAAQELLAILNSIRRARGEEPLSTFPEAPFCNFCGRSKTEVRAMVEGLNAHICDVCINHAQRLIRI